MKKRNKTLSLGIAYTTLALLFFPSAFAVEAPAAPEASQPSPHAYEYDLTAAYDFALLLRRIASDIASSDVSHGQYLRDVMSDDRTYVARRVYEHNGVHIEFTRDFSVYTMWKVRIPGLLLPKSMLSREYYLEKLRLKGLEASVSIISIQSDADTIAINFENGRVKDISLETSLD